MVSYQIHVHVQHDVYDRYVNWMREEHIPEMLRMPGFIDAELLLKKGGSMESSGKEVKIICHIRDEEALRAYLNGPALELRQKGIDKFPGQFSAHREIWLEAVSVSPRFEVK